MTRSGQAGASALKMVSTTVMGMVIHQRNAAGFVALTTRPGGSTIVSGRKAPSLMGSTRGVVRHLEAVWKQSLYKRRLYVICGARLRTDILDNRSLAMLLEISKGLIYQTLVSGQPLRGSRGA